MVAVLSPFLPALPRGRELLEHLARAGAVGANLARTALQPADKDSLTKKAEALRRAGYTETTPYDNQLRRLFGEYRWAMYASEPVRIPPLPR